MLNQRPGASVSISLQIIVGSFKLGLAKKMRTGRVAKRV